MAARPSPITSSTAHNPLCRYPIIEKARAAFETCQHYALGETLFALGKAQQGLGELLRAKEYFAAALAEFRRLELHHKAREAQAALETLTP
jgi:tetratricopeptide (TPR) repeat protein